MKQCSKCKEEKSREEFYKGDTKDGLASNCKVCKKAYREANKDKKNAYAKAYREGNKDKIKANREANKDKIKAKDKAYYEGNKDKKKEYNKAYREGNKDKIKAYAKAYREGNKDKKKEYNKAYREGNKDKKKEYNKAYREENKDKHKAYREENKDKINASRANRYHQDPLFVITSRIRDAINTALRKKGYRKSSNTMKIIGCSFDEFYEYIEVQFHSGMTWDNRSMWHLDHIVPVSFGVNEEEIIRLNHHSNFRPLWAEENMEKSNKLTEEALHHPIYHELLSRR